MIYSLRQTINFMLHRTYIVLLFCQRKNCVRYQRNILVNDFALSCYKHPGLQWAYLFGECSPAILESVILKLFADFSLCSCSCFTIQFCEHLNMTLAFEMQLFYLRLSYLCIEISIVSWVLSSITSRYLITTKLEGNLLVTSCTIV